MLANVIYVVGAIKVAKIAVGGVLLGVAGILKVAAIALEAINK